MATTASAAALPAAACARALAAAVMSPVATPTLGSPAPCLGGGGGCKPVHLLGRLKPHTQRPGPYALRCWR